MGEALSEGVFHGSRRRSSDQSDSTVSLARMLIAERRGIEKFIDASLFADPARDILLDLFVAASEQKRVTVSSCCIGASVPTTTALRWIRQLIAKGLVEAAVNPMDQRSRYVALSEAGRTKVRAYLDWVAARRS